MNIKKLVKGFLALVTCTVISVSMSKSTLAVNPYEEANLCFKEDGFKNHKVVFSVSKDSYCSADAYNISLSLSPPINMPIFNYFQINPFVHVRCAEELTKFDGLAIPKELYYRLDSLSKKMQELNSELYYCNFSSKSEYENHLQKIHDTSQIINETLCRTFINIISDLNSTGA